MDAAFGAVEDARVGGGDGGAVGYGASDGSIVDAGLSAVFVLKTCSDVNNPVHRALWLGIWVGLGRTSTSCAGIGVVLVAAKGVFDFVHES